MDSYDNDFLFIDDDLFLLLVPAECVFNDPNFTMIFVEDVDDGVDTV